MELTRTGNNELQIELNDFESEDIAYLIDRGLDDMDEYNDYGCLLKEHDKEFYRQLVKEIKNAIKYL